MPDERLVGECIGGLVQGRRAKRDRAGRGPVCRLRVHARIACPSSTEHGDRFVGAVGAFGRLRSCVPMAKMSARSRLSFTSHSSNTGSNDPLVNTLRRTSFCLHGHASSTPPGWSIWEIARATHWACCETEPCTG